MSDDQIARILAGLERLETGQTEFRADLTGRTDRLEIGQTQLRFDLMERKDRLQNKLTIFYDDIKVNMGRSEVRELRGDH